MKLVTAQPHHSCYSNRLNGSDSEWVETTDLGNVPHLDFDEARRTALDLLTKPLGDGLDEARLTFAGTVLHIAQLMDGTCVDKRRDDNKPHGFKEIDAETAEDIRYLLCLTVSAYERARKARQQGNA